MDSKTRKFIFFAILVGVAGLLFLTVKSNEATSTYAQFLRQVQSGEVTKAVISATHTPVQYSLKDGSQASAMLPRDYREALDAMRRKMVDIQIRDNTPTGSRVLLNSTPFLILLAIWIIMMTRQIRGAK